MSDANISNPKYKRTRSKRVKRRGTKYSYRDEEIPDIRNGVQTDNTSDRDSVLSITSTLEQIELRDRSDDYNDRYRVSSVVLDAMISAAPDYKDPEEEERYSEKTTEEIEEVAVNYRFLSRQASSYELEKFEENVMYIFNQVNVSGYEPRRGTEYDVMALEKCFGSVGFRVVVHNDYDKKDIFKTLEQVSNSDFSNTGCVSVVVLTHGSRGGYLHAKDREYHESELINYFKTFNKPTLITKPKVFIIQACRGTRVSAAVTAGKVAKSIMYDASRQPEFYTLPTESDILLLHSTYAGNVAHRDEQNGSWFIQTLCKSISEQASTHDLETIVTQVQKQVAIYRQNIVFNRATGVMDINKQMPVKTSTLIRKLYLKPQSLKTKLDRLSKSSIDDEVSVSKTDMMSYMSGTYMTVEHFEYIRNTLKFFYDEHPEETMALPLLNIAQSIDLNEVSYNVRHSVANEIQYYLRKSATKWKYYELIYFVGA